MTTIGGNSFNRMPPTGLAKLLLLDPDVKKIGGRCFAGRIDDIECLLSKAGAKPEDIGTTQTRLDELRRRGHLNQAKSELAWTEEFGPQPDRVCIIETCLHAAGAKPEDIGTTQARLDELRRR